LIHAHPLRISLAALILAVSIVPATPAKQTTIVSETIEWTWEVKPEQPQVGLPNVLLLGDSITRNYFHAVRQELQGKANVYLFATSACAGDPRLPAQLAEFFAMENVPFRVIHFNNGMHGWGYTEPQYGKGLETLLHTLKSKMPAAVLLWANTTPVRKDNPAGAGNARITARDNIAQDLMTRNHVPIDDQYKLVQAAGLDVYSDDVHLNEKTSQLQGNQAAALIEQSLR
jgi:hypothetical protein